MAAIFKMAAQNNLLHLSLAYMANKTLLNYYVKCKQYHFDLFFNKSYLGRNKMATTFKMAALNVMFRHWSSLLIDCYKNRASNFKIDRKSGIKLHYVK